MVLNRRPLGVRRGEILEPITPGDVIPVWSNIQAGLSRANCTKIIEAACKDFPRKWSSLYDLCILRQHKWTKSNCNLQLGYVVIIRDLLDSKTQYPRLLMGLLPDTLQWSTRLETKSCLFRGLHKVLILSVNGTEDTLVDVLQFLKKSDLSTEPDINSEPVPVRPNRGTVTWILVE